MWFVLCDDGVGFVECTKEYWEERERERSDDDERALLAK